MSPARGGVLRAGSVALLLAAAGVFPPGPAATPDSVSALGSPTEDEMTGVVATGLGPRPSGGVVRVHDPADPSVGNTRRSILPAYSPTASAAGLVQDTLVIDPRGARLARVAVGEAVDTAQDVRPSVVHGPERLSVALDRRLEATPDSTPLDEVLVELRIGRLVGRTVVAWMDGSAVLLPVATLLEMGEVDHAVGSGGLLNAVVHPGSRIVVFDPLAGRASLAGREVEVRPDTYAVRDGHLYLAAGIIEDLFGVSIHTDPGTLTTVVMNPGVLPLGRRLERETRWRYLQAEGGSGSAAGLVNLNEATLGGAVLDWSLSSALDDPSGSLSYAVGLGGRAWGGGFQLSARSLGSASSGERVVDASYRKVWRDRPWLTQMRLGDGYSTGPRLRSVRGVSLTNAPYLRPAFFGTDSFSGRVGPGWDVELRQAGRTLDLTRSDEQGAFALDIPLRYGDNPIQVVAFGPHGEVVTTEKLVLLGADRLPAGQLEWGASGGVCRDEQCDLTGNIDLRYGLSNRWTIRGGLEGFSRSEGRGLAQPYVEVSGTPVQGLHVSAETLVDGYARLGTIFQPTSALRIRAAHTAFDSGVLDPVLHDGRRRSTTEGDVFLRPLGSSSRWFVQGSVLRQALETGTLSRWQGSTSLQSGRLGMELGLRREVDDPTVGHRRVASFPFVTGMTHLALWGRRPLWIRTELEGAGLDEVNRLEGRIAYQATPTARVEMGAGWRRGFGSSLSLSVSADLDPFRSVTQLFAPEGERARVMQVTRGTVQWNEALGDLGVRARPGLERGGLAGYVFIDTDGDGERDPEERGVPGVRLVVGGKTVTTDQNGRHTLWDLVPYEPLTVWTDSSSIPDPRLVPVEAAVRVVAPPSSYGRLDVALTPSREITGRVVRTSDSGALVGVGHLDLELVDAARGGVRPLKTFSDGTFYESGVPPGRYELRIGPEALRGSGWIQDGGPVALQVRVGDGAGPVAPVELRLVPEAETPGGVR